MNNEPMNVDLLPASTITEAIVRAEADIQISTAKRFPMHSTAKDIARFQSELLDMVTTDEETAESCLYTLPRKKEVTKGGKKVWVPIEGRSVRFAEICQSAYGNMRTATRIVEESERFVTVEGVAHDLERNVSQSSQIRRRITKANGERYNEDGITNTVNAASSIASRNAILKVVPAALTQKAYDAAKVKATGGDVPLVARVARMFGKFALMGVFEDRIMHRIEKAEQSEITEADIVSLAGLFNAVKSGEINIDETFPIPPEKATISMDDVKPAKAKKKDDAPAPLDVAPDEAPTVPDEVFTATQGMDLILLGRVWALAEAAGWTPKKFIDEFNFSGSDNEALENIVVELETAKEQ